MSRKAEIKLFVELDEKNIPVKLTWTASDVLNGKIQDSKAFFLNIWDTHKKETMAMHLWESKMGVDEMDEFVFQSMMHIADTYEKSTSRKEQAEKIRDQALEIFAETREK